MYDDLNRHGEFEASCAALARTCLPSRYLHCVPLYIYLNFPSPPLRTSLVTCMHNQMSLEKQKVDKRKETVLCCFAGAALLSYRWQSFPYMPSGRAIQSRKGKTFLTFQQYLMTFQNLHSSLGKYLSCIHCLNVVPFLIVLCHLQASGKVSVSQGVGWGKRVCALLPSFSGWYCVNQVNQEQWLIENEDWIIQVIIYHFFCGRRARFLLKKIAQGTLLLGNLFSDLC